MKLAVAKKSLQIDQANSKIYIAVTVAVLVTIFSLVSTKALLDQAGYQRRVINARQATVKQLRTNLVDANSLSEQYNQFNSGTTNVIGGKNSSDPNATPPDGDNARIVLNALPSTYDFPALISSMSKILSDNRVSTPSIGGSDQSKTIDGSASSTPTSVPVPLSISGVTNYEGVQNLLRDLERSTRPFDVSTLQLRGSNASMAFSFELNTYFQPAKKLTLSDKEVK